MNNRVAVAVCNYNRSRIASKAVSALLSSDMGNLTIHFVDNGSTDDSVAMVRELYGKKVNLIELAENKGSSGGFAEAIESALKDGSDYILMLDSDCVVNPDTLRILVDYLDKNIRFSVVGPKLYWPVPPGRVQEFGARIDWEMAQASGYNKGYDEVVYPPLSGDREVDYVAGCCLLVRRRVVESVGNIDSSYFLYFDDVEWQWRMRLGGERIAVTGMASAFHNCGAMSKGNHASTFYHWRNRIRFFMSYCGVYRKESVLQKILSDAARAIATTRTLGANNAGNAIELAVADGLSSLCGKREFSGIDLSIDQVNELLPVDGLRREIPVGHVFECNPESYAGQEDVVLCDSFGKKLPVGVVLELLPLYHSEYNCAAMRIEKLRMIQEEKEKRKAHSCES